DVRVIDAVLDPLGLPAAQVARLHAALTAKDAAELHTLARDLPDAARADLTLLPTLYGDASVLAQARRGLTPSPALNTALDELQWLADRVQGMHLSFDLSDLRGYAYYSGVRFTVFARDAKGPAADIARGGRYDEVGAVFGRKRPAVGFSLDLKELVAAVAPRALAAAIRAPWGSDDGLREAVAALRAQGQTVVCALPGHGHQ